MKSKSTCTCVIPNLAAIFVVAIVMAGSSNVFAWTSKDQTLELRGYVDNTTYYRTGTQDGISKMRNRAQLQFAKTFQPGSPLSELSLHGILRGSYDAAYDLNDSDWGDKSGGSVMLESLGGPDLGLPGMVPWGAGANPFVSPVVLPGTNPYVSGTSPYLNGFFLGPNGGTNPNEGLMYLGLHGLGHERTALSGVQQPLRLDARTLFRCGHTIQQRK